MTYYEIMTTITSTSRLTEYLGVKIAETRPKSVFVRSEGKDLYFDYLTYEEIRREYPQIARKYHF